MLFPRRHWAGLTDGTITLAFRRWRSPHARAGALHRTPAGLLAIGAVDVVEPDRIGDDEARRAGYASRDELLGSLRGTGDLYRIELRHAGDDPRIALRAAEDLADEDVAALSTRLARLDDASRHGPWTLATMRVIAERPAVVSTELAEELERERLPFKRDVRKLKELGLTESLEVGYRLSPRGRALLERLDDPGSPALATIGVYGFTAETFLTALRDADVRQVLDVRQRRAVRGSEYAWANAGRLQEALAAAGIAYRHHKELAPTAELRELQYGEDARGGVGKRERATLAPAFRERYAEEILDRVDLEPLVRDLPAEGHAALLCVERDPEACHRSLIADRLAVEHGVPVLHLRPEAQPRA